MMWEDHTFVICAYGESPYLEACIRSLEGQKMKSRILIAAAHSNEVIQKAARKYGLETVVSGKEPRIAGDWNFALASAKTPYVTLAHQDDLYFPEYTFRIRQAAEHAERPLIFFTDYYEAREGEMIQSNRLLRVKRLLLTPLRLQSLQKSRWVRRRILSFGNAICCPSVTYAMANLPKELFQEGYRSNVDWDAWERLSRKQGEFVYIYRPLMAHRIHQESETSHTISGTGRGGEDTSMLRRFWPGWAAALIEKFYAAGEKSNGQ